MSAIGLLVRPVGLGVVGFFVGAIIGILTRPTILGMPIPLEVYASQSPMDQPFKEQLTSHIGLAGIAGAAVFAILGYAWVYLQNTNAPTRRQQITGLSYSSEPRFVPTKGYDVARWKTLVDCDPELRAAVSQIAVYGSKYIDKLATDFLTLNDKSYLATIIANTEKLAKSDLDRGTNPTDYDVVKWKYYADYDPEIIDAVRHLNRYGLGYVDMLARAFLAANNDKSMISGFVSKIEAQAIRDLESQPDDYPLRNA